MAALTWAGHSSDFGIGGKQLVQWEDGRSPAGILTTNSMLTRWESNGDNHNRERANLVSRALLCDDYGLRDIPLTGNIDLSDPLAVADAVNTQPECVACHSSDLDSQYRAGAPDTVNLDTLDDVRQWNERILARVFNEDSPMPSAGLPA